MITKLYPTRSHTGAAQGGMAAALANVEEDSNEWHTYDTVKGGDYLIDQDSAEILTREAIDAVYDLENMGLPFNRTEDGKIDQRRFGGHTRDHGKAPVRRACYAADRTGHMILQTLYQNCVKHGVNFFNEFYALDLIMAEVDGVKRVAGIVAYELATGEIHVFQGKSVIFATGGFGKIYKTTSNAHTLTGDGVGIVWRKGLPLEDMEFYQFHPTGLAGLGILLTEGARGEGAILRNASGERFMERYAPTIKDLAPRDIVARSMVQEVLDGRGAGPHKDYVYLDCTHLGAEVLETKLPDITEFARTYLGVDPVTERVPVYPTAHYAMGGIPTNNDAEVLSDNETVVPGLYAAGECACVSVHGANRLGTNSLLDINVFGKRAGNNAVTYAQTADFVDLPTDAADGVVKLLAQLRESAAAPRTSPRSARRCRRRWTATPRCSAPRRRCRPRSPTSRCCASATRTCASTTAAGASTPICSRPSSSASCSTWRRSSWSRRSTARSRAARTCATTTPPATTRTTCSTPWPTARRATWACRRTSGWTGSRCA